MIPRSWRPVLLGAAVGGVVAVTVVAGCSGPADPSAGGPAAAVSPAAAPSQPATSGGGASGGVGTATGVDVYAAAGRGMLSAAVRHDVPMVYVPDTLSNEVQEIDPRTDKVVRTFRVKSVPEHVVPSWDLRTLWVNETGGNELTPIDPRTGRPGTPKKVDDPYNLYFTPDGRHAIVMAERLRRIDYRDPRTMRLQHSIKVPCRGVNHADYTADLTTYVVSCEFSGKLLVIPADGSRIEKVVDLNKARSPGEPTPAMAHRMPAPASALDPTANSMPQDVRLLPDGSAFLVADMVRGGVWVLDAKTFSVTGFVPTGMGAHGIYPSRDARSMYVSNRDAGSVSVLDAATRKVTATWRIPGGGTPDMGGVTADGAQLWLSGRSSSAVYVFDTATGRLLHKIPVGAGPHGLCVWPQPGAFSLGHTGNMR